MRQIFFQKNEKKTGFTFVYHQLFRVATNKFFLYKYSNNCCSGFPSQTDCAYCKFNRLYCFRSVACQQELLQTVYVWYYYSYFFPKKVVLFCTSISLNLTLATILPTIINVEVTRTNNCRRCCFFNTCYSVSEWCSHNKFNFCLNKTTNETQTQWRGRITYSVHAGTHIFYAFSKQTAQNIFNLLTWNHFLSHIEFVFRPFLESHNSNRGLKQIRVAKM